MMSPTASTSAPSEMCASTAPTIELMAIEPAPPIESPPLPAIPAAIPMIAGEESASIVISPLELSVGFLGEGGDRVLDQVVRQRHPDGRPADGPADPAGRADDARGVAGLDQDRPSGDDDRQHGRVHRVDDRRLDDVLDQVGRRRPRRGEAVAAAAGDPDRDAHDVRLREGGHADPAGDIDVRTLDHGGGGSVDLVEPDRRPEPAPMPTATAPPTAMIPEESRARTSRAVVPPALPAGSVTVDFLTDASTAALMRLTKTIPAPAEESSPLFAPTDPVIAMIRGSSDGSAFSAWTASVPSAMVMVESEM